MNSKKWNKEIKRFLMEAGKASLFPEGIFLMEGNLHRDILLIKEVLAESTNSASTKKQLKFSSWGLKLLTSYESGGDPPTK